ncbi:MAG: hypothetical protein ACOX4I_03530 [Anaerovoracaceae bacterium]|jgi:uncharacterized membrane protein
MKMNLFIKLVIAAIIVTGLFVGTYFFIIDSYPFDDADKVAHYYDTVLLLKGLLSTGWILSLSIIFSSSSLLKIK